MPPEELDKLARHVRQWIWAERRRGATPLQLFTWTRDARWPVECFIASNAGCKWYGLDQQTIKAVSDRVIALTGT